MGNEYFIEGDKKCLDEYEEYVSYQSDSYQIKYKYHLDVLPQPYFGNITEPKVLFLGKNPSYDITGLYGYTDIQDVDDFESDLKEGKTSFESYLKGLCKVDFFKEVPRQNEYYAKGAWGWWHNKVIGSSLGKTIDSSKVGFINLSPYHSIRYNDISKNVFCSQDDLKRKLKSILPGVDLLIIVWGKGVWERFIKNSYDEELMGLFNSKSKLVLNKIKGKSKYGQNIISIKKILSGYYDEDTSMDEMEKKGLDVLKEMFSYEKIDK